MTPDTTVILGIPVDIVDLDDTLNRLAAMFSAYDRDGRPRIAVTVDTDTVIALKTRRRQNPYAGALMNTLRRADLLIPVGIPINFAASVIGTTLKQRFSGLNLFQRVLRDAESAEKTLFLLGNGNQTMQAASEMITAAHPGLKIAGIGSINQKTDADGRDPGSGLAEQINGTGADMLIVDLKDAVVGQWFEKYRHRLYVPLILVITGAQDLIRAASKNRPYQKQTLQIHRRHRLRLFAANIWRRFFYGFMMFGLTILPLMLYQKYQQLVFKMFHVRPTIPSIKSSFSRSGPGVTLKIITMPDPLDASVIDEIKGEIKAAVRQSPKTVLDFSHVTFIDSSGLGLMLALWRQAAAKNREMFIVGVRSPVYRFLKLSRTLDFFEKSMFETVDDVLSFIAQRSNFSSFYYLALIRGEAAVFHLYGELDASQMIDLDFNAIFDTIGDRNAVINLTGLDFVDSAGMRLFVKIQRHVARHGRTCILCGLQEHVRQMFQILRLKRLFVVTENIFGAELALRRMRNEMRPEMHQRPDSLPADG